MPALVKSSSPPSHFPSQVPTLTYHRLRRPFVSVRPPPLDSQVRPPQSLARDSFLGAQSGSPAALLETFPVNGPPRGVAGRRAVQMDRGSGVGGMPPPHQQMPDDVGLAAAADPQFVMMRNSCREKIFEYIGRKQTSADWRRRLPELTRRLEEILYRKFPNKSEYYNMMLGRIEPHLQFAIKTLSAQNQQRLQNQQLPARQIASSLGYGTTTPTPAITQGASENFGMSDVTHHMGPSSSGAGMVPRNNTGEGPDEHVNTLLSLGMNSTHNFSRVSNNNPAPPAPVKEVPKEPRFSCPVCMNELVDASSTTCGHIFCDRCIKASIQAQSKCPTCRRTLSLRGFHRVYLPTMD